ncbi:4-galactosyl-N-acetylglucosaminide 3-alpha-L-fucosyltransferase FUT6-like [Dendropsophus ebraccatus]|uniref:4-galactosyl-N-acetylglucosaminide 3-alpha-L-fucosyltransferase FUT6-like n=1 Tax=Dendropsophus ebraccatus TaxID=150705 RepID=UPI0038316C5B
MSPTNHPPKLSKMFFFFLLQIFISFTLFSTLFNKRKAPGLNNNGSQENVAKSHVAPKEPELVILLWSYPFQHNFTLNQCPQKFDGSGCFYTADRDMYSQAHAVVLHHRDVCGSKEQLPQAPRPSNQYWIWFSLESPSHCPNPAFMNNVINLTMSYRADSDIFTPYGWIEKHNGSVNFAIPKKTRLVAWAVSNWNPSSKRVWYYQRLKKYLHVDVYGMHHLDLPRHNNTQSQTFSTYKFYFAFENSIHEDYITEKLWINALFSGCVPVVLGPPRANYERFIPGDAFIHVDDFSSPQELASYLLSLDADEEKYKKYFSWRLKYQLPEQEPPWVVPYCKICKALKEAPSFRTIPSIEAWFK